MEYTVYADSPQELMREVIAYLTREANNMRSRARMHTALKHIARLNAAGDALETCAMFLSELKIEPRKADV